MFKNKPEVIDPEEKNITYYSYRNKEEKRLGETSCCKSSKTFRPHFMMMMGLLVMVVILYFFASKNLDNRSQVQAEITADSLHGVLSAYGIPEQNKTYAQVVFKNQAESDLKIFVNRAHFIGLGDKKEVAAQTLIESKELLFTPGSVQNLAVELETPKPLQSIKVFLVINGKEWVLEKKLPRP